MFRCSRALTSQFQDVALVLSMIELDELYSWYSTIAGLNSIMHVMFCKAMQLGFVLPLFFKRPAIASLSV